MELLVILLMPAAAAAVSLVARRRGAEIATLAAAAVAVVLAVFTARRAVVDGSVATAKGWLVCDPLGAVVLVLVAFVGFTAALFSIGYLRHRHARARKGGGYYYPLFNLFLLSMLAVPMLANIALVWIAIALTTLVSAFLVAYQDTPEALEAAWKYVVLTTLGAVVALLGVVFLYWGMRLSGDGAFTWDGLRAAAPHLPPAVLWIAFLLVLVGFGTKAGLAPMHTWLPDAHSQAPASVCALLSGVETTTALYAVLRLLPALDAAGLSQARAWFVVFGLVSVGAAALLLVHVRDFKRMFAFSTVEHMGIIMIAVGFGGPAHLGAVYQIGAHAFAKSFCFFGAGAAVLAAGTQEIAAVRGLIWRSPAAAWALLFGGLAIAGAPPFAVFLSEFAILKAGIAERQYWAVGLLGLFVVIAFCAIMAHVVRMVFGTAEASKTEASPIPWSCSAALAVAAVPVICLGVYIPAGLRELVAASAALLGGLP